MKQLSTLQGTVLGGITSIPVLALSYLGFQLAGLPFAAYSLFDVLVRVLPGVIVTFGIDSMLAILTVLNLGSTSSSAKTAERLSALLLFFIAGSLFGAVMSVIGRREPKRLISSGVLGGLTWALVLMLVLAYLGFAGVTPLAALIWLGGLMVAWGITLGWLFKVVPLVLAESPEAPVSRRGFLFIFGGGALTITLGSLGLASLVEGESTITVGDSPETHDFSTTSGSAASPTNETLAARIEPTAGTREEITPKGKFYSVDINSLPPNLDADTWKLPLVGLVERPLSLSLADVRSRPSISQVITLSCISNSVGGDLIGTALWKGVRLRDLLEEAGLMAEARSLFIESADGFFESVSLKDALDERTLLVYDMNDAPLERKHGFPLRIYIPGRFGMKQPKWIERIEAINHDGPGYWVDRGWSAEAFVRMTSVIDDVSTKDFDETTGVVPIGGIAYSGAKTISKVEVQIDDEPWAEAQLRIPPLSPLTWVQWRYDWQGTPGSHTVRVRALDGVGQSQDSQQRRSRPDGATGIHTQDFRL
jgi:DMSO/TMAO reductase YedYZ molybdopterin-dependent catalytic subunit